MRVNWEKAVEKLLPADPVVNKLTNKRKNAHMSGVTCLKKVGPKTGVELRFYKYKEFAALSDAQQEEPCELRPKGKGVTERVNLVRTKESLAPLTRKIAIGQRSK